MSLAERLAGLFRAAPRDRTPNSNPAVGTVGPNTSAGFGNTHGLYRPPDRNAEAWSGWPQNWDTPPLEAGGAGRWSGFGYGRHDPDGFLERVSTVMNCVDLNSANLASFPLYGVEERRTVALPAWATNPEPSLYANWYEFALAAFNDLQLAGEVFVWATGFDRNGWPARFVTLDPAHMVVDTGVDGLTYEHRGRDLDPVDVLHVKYQTVTGSVRGITPLQWANRNLVGAAALADYATDIAEHGIWALLTHPSNMNATQRDEARDNWMNARAARPGAPAVVSGGWQFETLSLSPADMALLDIATMNDQRICGSFRVPPYLVGVDSPGSLTYANVSQLTDHHWRIALRTTAKNFATALSQWALPPSVSIEFDRDEYVRPPLDERAAAWATLHGIVDADGRRAMTVDEVREFERFDRIDDNDDDPTSSVLTGGNP